MPDSRFGNWLGRSFINFITDKSGILIFWENIFYLAKNLNYENLHIDIDSPCNRM